MEFSKSRQLREEMVHTQLERRGIHSPNVLEAMREIPRECFIPEERRYQAYYDGALSIGMHQTISQPYIVALMTEALELGPEDRTLEIGTGSGYQTAILAYLCRWVYTVERIAVLSEQAQQNLKDLEIQNIAFFIGDGTLGIPEEEPFDAIIVTAAAPRMPGKLFDQLKDGGRLVAPVGDRSHQVLYRYLRRGDRFERKFLCDCVFVPLLGEEGWDVEG